MQRGMGSEQRPTLEMVAAAAGVSRGTASRALNGGVNVSRRAMEAVERAASELGYRPNLTARALVLGRSESIGLVVSETDERLFGDPYFARMTRGVHSELAGSGIQLILALAQNDEERSQLARFATGRHLDGVLLISVHQADPLSLALEEAGIPVVVSGRPSERENRGGAWWVDSDNRGGARSAVEYLIGLGRRRVAVITGPLDMSAGWDRLQGWREAMTAANGAAPSSLVVHGDFTEESGALAARKLLARGREFDAVFAASDLMAFGAMEILREAGLRIPEDVAVVGFDDVQGAERSDPPLTTVVQRVDEMGRLMVRMLLQRLNGDPVDSTHLIVPTGFVIRGSA
jgi:DNA-binding LacI/PurR family transcriptional regulator